MEIVQKNLFRFFFYFGWIFSDGFSSSEYLLCNLEEINSSCHEGRPAEPVRGSSKPLFVAKSPWFL